MREASDNLAGGCKAAVGVDLAARENRTTAIAIALCYESKCRLHRIFSGPLKDDEVIRIIRSNTATCLPAVVVVDAPLSLPQSGGFRVVERMFLKEGAKLLPLTLKPMRQLALRGQRLARELEKLGFKVFETHPRSVLYICGLSRARRLLEIIGVEAGDIQLESYSRHVEDALVALAVAACILKGCDKRLEAEDGVIVFIPRDKCVR